MKAKDKLGLVLLLCVLVVSLVVPGYSEAEMKTVEDALGRTMQVPEEVERIVGLEAGALRVITYLEATEMVVGVENFEKRDRKRPYRLAHPKLAERPNLGPIHGGDPELIVAAQPEVIFWSYATKRKADDLQSKTGIPVFVLNPGPPRTMGREDLYSALRRVGKAIDAEARAEEVIGFIEGEIAKLRKLGKAKKREGVDAYVGGIGQKGAHGISSTEPSYPPFSFIGLTNAAGEVGTEHAMVSEEKVIQWNPDYLFVDAAGLSLVKKDLEEPQFRSLAAVRQERAYRLLPYNYYTTNFGTLLADAYYIGKTVYPGAFAGVNPVREANRIYEFLVGEPVYKPMEEIFGGFGKVETEG